MQRSTRKSYDPPSDGADPRERALGMLELLTSAHALARLHHVDRTSMAKLEQCIDRLRAVHGLAPPAVDDESDWLESSLPGLLRLLVYLHAEAADGLGDAVCAASLQECIMQLARAYQLSPDQLCHGHADPCH